MRRGENNFKNMLNLQEYKTITNEQLERWWKFKKNIIIFGEKGVGKTSIIKGFFEKKKIKCAYFSGATLDPWIDLIGIPKVFEEKGKIFTKFAIPENIPHDVEVIYVDEINRAIPKIQSCLLELMTDKSINGRKFPNLKAVWAAGNPPDSDENYAVEDLCPALDDRFEIKIKLADEPSLEYFTGKYGSLVASNAINWRKRLADELKPLVSPRRLDYALDYVINCGGPAREVLPDMRLNVSTLMKAIKGNETLDELRESVDSKDPSRIEKFFKNQKKVQQCLGEILFNSDLTRKMIQFADIEFIFGLAEAELRLPPLIANAMLTRPQIKQGLEDARKATGNYPNWYLNGARKLGDSRAALAQFEREVGFYIKNEAQINVSDFNLDESPHENLDSVNIQISKHSLVSLDKDSAVAILKYSKHLKASGFVFIDSTEKIKHESLIVSALNHFYEQDGNLLSVEFEENNTLDLIYNCHSHAGKHSPKNRGGLMEVSL